MQPLAVPAEIPDALFHGRTGTSAVADVIMEGGGAAHEPQAKGGTIQRAIGLANIGVRCSALVIRAGGKS